MDLTLRGIYKIILLPQATALDLMRSCDKSSQKLWGILTRKDRWGLSCRGWLLLSSTGLVAA
jgi:hypothetical protein